MHFYRNTVHTIIAELKSSETKISETDVSLREIVQDAAGEWIERTSVIQLQEKAR